MMKDFLAYVPDMGMGGWGLILCIALAVVVGIYLLIKKSSRT
jgi:hypothetical protein